MAKELPPRAELEGQIATINANLYRIDLPSNRSIPAFWNHYLHGSALSLAAVQIEIAQYKGTKLDEDGNITLLQRRAVVLMEVWTHDPEVTHPPWSKKVATPF